MLNDRLSSSEEDSWLQNGYLEGQYTTVSRILYGRLFVYELQVWKFGGKSFIPSPAEKGLKQPHIVRGYEQHGSLRTKSFSAHGNSTLKIRSAFCDERLRKTIHSTPRTLLTTPAHEILLKQIAQGV